MKDKYRSLIKWFASTAFAWFIGLLLGAFFTLPISSFVEDTKNNILGLKEDVIISVLIQNYTTYEPLNITNTTYSIYLTRGCRNMLLQNILIKNSTPLIEETSFSGRTFSCSNSKDKCYTYTITNYNDGNLPIKNLVVDVEFPQTKIELTDDIDPEIKLSPYKGFFNKGKMHYEITYLDNKSASIVFSSNNFSYPDASCIFDIDNKNCNFLIKYMKGIEIGAETIIPFQLKDRFGTASGVLPLSLEKGIYRLNLSTLQWSNISSYGESYCIS